MVEIIAGSRSSQGAHLDEHGPVADIASVMEISGEQRLDDGTLYALAAGRARSTYGASRVLAVRPISSCRKTSPSDRADVRRQRHRHAGRWAKASATGLAAGAVAAGNHLGGCFRAAASAASRFLAASARRSAPSRAMVRSAERRSFRLCFDDACFDVSPIFLILLLSYRSIVALKRVAFCVAFALHLRWHPIGTPELKVHSGFHASWKSRLGC